MRRGIIVKRSSERGERNEEKWHENATEAFRKPEWNLEN